GVVGVFLRGRLLHVLRLGSESRGRLFPRPGAGVLKKRVRQRAEPLLLSSAREGDSPSSSCPLPYSTVVRASQRSAQPAALPGRCPRFSSLTGSTPAV